MSRLIPFVIVILIVLGILVGLPFLLQPDSHRAQIAQYLSDQLHHRVVIGQVDASIFPPSLRLHDVTVLRTGEDAPLFRGERIDVGPDWASLFKFKFVPASITLNRWLLDVRRRQDGSWDWNEWATPLTASGAGGGSLQKVTFHQGECHWVDNYAAVSQELVLQTIEGTLDRAQQQLHATGNLTGLTTPLGVTFDGRGHFLSAQGWAGDLKLTDQNRQWMLHLEDAQNALDVKGQAAEWQASRAWSLLSFYCRWKNETSASSDAVFTEWHNHFTWSASSMTFDESGALAGGPTELKGEAATVGDHINVALTVSLQNVPAEVLGALVGETLPVDGKLTTASRVAFPVSPHSWTGLHGDGLIHLQDGHFHFSDTALHGLAKAHTMAYLNAKFPDLAQTGLPAHQLDVHFAAQNGEIKIDKAMLDAGDLKASLSGRLDGVRRGVDAGLRLDIREKDKNLLKKLPGRYLYGAPGAEKVQPIYGRVQGSWSEWTVRSVKKSKAF